jgi:hypothetical protein
MRDRKTTRGRHLDDDAPVASGDTVNRPRLGGPAQKRPRDTGRQIASDNEHLIVPVSHVDEGIAVNGHWRADDAETNRPRLVDELDRDSGIARI